MKRLGNERPVATATRALARLNKQADEVRAELLGLRHNLKEAQQSLSEVRAAELREANEHLVLAALHAETIADNALASLSEMTRVSQRDALTNTPNRALMIDRLHNAIAVARRHGTRFAVLFVDLDDFKQVNDTLGHVAGDGVLQQAARHLQSVVRDSDTVSRYGGDEFLVLLADVAQASDAALVAAKILGGVAQAIHVDDHEVHLSASIGIAIYPDDAEEAATLISRADAAMYRSKRRQRGGFALASENHRDASPVAATNESPHRQATRSDLTAAAHDAHVHDLREANEHLVLAALAAQELEAHAREVHNRQVAFLAMVAHELRSPLTPIQTAAELLSRAHADEPLLDQLQALIKGRVAHMARLVDDLLDGSRACSGRFQLERCPVEMTHILKLTVETCRPAMDVKLQQLKLHLPRRPLTVHGDPMRLAQIFSNLLSNASKYTPQGGRITVSVTKHGHSMAITVSDSGIGITPEALPYIFELFVRDPRAMALDSAGLGVGLAVVRDLVEAHGGTVVATSAGKNLGSQFVVTLPMKAKNAQVLHS